MRMHDPFSFLYPDQFHFPFSPESSESLCIELVAFVTLNIVRSAFVDGATSFLAISVQIAFFLLLLLLILFTTHKHRICTPIM